MTVRGIIYAIMGAAALYTFLDHLCVEAHHIRLLAAGGVGLILMGIVSGIPWKM